MDIQSPDPTLPNHERLQINETKDRIINEEFFDCKCALTLLRLDNANILSQHQPPSAISSHFRWRTPTMERVLECVQCGCTFLGYPTNPKNFLLKRYSTTIMKPNKEDRAYFCGKNHWDSECQTYSSVDSQLKRLKEMKRRTICTKSTHQSNE
uniref:Uncharacterized protein n=1 Tax=Wuchereria bancrofti TaxID=6293 RepID=A0AAF5RXW6_WUCBA